MTELICPHCGHESFHHADDPDRWVDSHGLNRDGTPVGPGDRLRCLLCEAETTAENATYRPAPAPY